MSSISVKQTIALDAAQAGMVLAVDLRDGHGNLLLPQGGVLTDAMLQALQRHGVVSLEIVGEAKEVVIDEAQQEAEKARLKHRFRLAGNDIPVLTLYHAMLHYRLGQEG